MEMASFCSDSHRVREIGATRSRCHEDGQASRVASTLTPVREERIVNPTIAPYNEETPPMRIGFITDLSEEDFRFAQDNGFPCVEYISFGNAFVANRREYLNAMRRRYHVDFSMLALFSENYISDDPAVSHKAFANAETLMDLCSDIESPLFVTCAGESEGRPLTENARRAVDALGRLLDYGKKRGVGVALYNCHITNFAFGPEAWEQILPHLPELGIKFDPSHPFYDGRDYLVELRDWGARVKHVHAKGAVILGGKPFEDPPAGMDQIDWGTLFAILYHHGYNADINIEPHAQTWLGERRYAGILLAQRHLRRYVL